MKDPDRWLNDQNLSAEMRELLRAGAAPPTIPEEQERRIGMFVTRVAAGTLGTSLLFSTKVVAAMIALAAGGTVTWAAIHYTSEREVVPAGKVEQTASVRAPVVAVQQVATSPVQDSKLREAPALPLPTPPVDTVAKDATPQAKGNVTKAPVRPVRGELTSHAVHAQPLPPEDSLGAEAALLEQARGLLKTNSKQALAVAEQHARSFRTGQLAAERELIAIEALQRLGRTGEAERRARTLIAREPNGMYARRALRLIDATQP